MAIYRGAGGAGDATGDSASEALLVRELAAEVALDAAAAEAAKLAAQAAQAAAETAETNAETAETNAETAETNAETAATAAATSASNAASSASTATSQVSLAATSATNAAASATSSASSASNSASSATAAASSASSAATSLLAVQQVFDDFDDTYLGAKASDPTVDNDGDALIAGAVYFNTTEEEIRFYNGTAWERPEYAASQSALAAQSSATAAASSASDSSTAASNAASSASSASSSASTATTQAGLAATSASNASTSETNAASSASTATTQAGIATTQASNAASSATAAASSASAAATSETNAASSASSAATSASNAAASATLAASYTPSQTGNAGKYLTTDGTNTSWDALATVANTGSYNDLSDKPTLTTNLDGLTDVVITSPVSDQVLKYDGTNWVNGTGGGGGVTSFNTRTGAVTLSSGDVTTALGYTPYNANGNTVITSANIGSQSVNYASSAGSASSVSASTVFSAINGQSNSDWYRTSGSTGWYNSTYGGGVWMTDTTWVRVYASKAFYVENTIASTGNITAYYSDMRLKTKVGDIENALEKVKSLAGFYYVENDLARSFGYKSEKKQVALSAQKVQEVMPEATSLAPFDMDTKEDGSIVSKSGENYLTVDYERLVPLLVEAIKELEAQVAELKAK